MGERQPAYRRDTGWVTEAEHQGKMQAKRDEIERLRAALREVAAVLGGGGCAKIACPGCAYEMRSAASTARDALGE
jgi:hypothetical protein